MERQEFINVISKKLNRPMPTDVSAPTLKNSVHLEAHQEKSHDELVDQFKEISGRIGATIVETSKEQLTDAIIKHLPDYVKNKTVLLSKESLIEDVKLFEVLQEQGYEAKKWEDSTREALISLAQTSEVGIVCAEMALSETATVLLNNEGVKGRSISLLPETSFILINRENIVPRMTQAMQYLHEHKGEFAKSVNFVSGPSATADIELVRVVGAHGPINIVYVIVE